jgi:hypothetical protein
VAHVLHPLLDVTAHASDRHVELGRSFEMELVRESACRVRLALAGHLAFREASRLWLETRQAIFVARRSTTSDGFGASELIPELNDAWSWPDWISPDECTIVIHSNRSGEVGGADLYIAERGR